MTASIDTEIQDLGRQRPEWQPWLSVVQQVLRETADAKWDAVIPDRAEPLRKQGADSSRRFDRARNEVAASLDPAADRHRQP